MRDLSRPGVRVACGVARGRLSLSDPGRIVFADLDRNLVTGIDPVELVIAAVELQFTALALARLRIGIAEVEDRGAVHRLAARLAHLFPLVDRIAVVRSRALTGRLVVAVKLGGD